jgi:hypothetical protein
MTYRAPRREHPSPVVYEGRRFAASIEGSSLVVTGKADETPDALYGALKMLIPLVISNRGVDPSYTCVKARDTTDNLSLRLHDNKRWRNFKREEYETARQSWNRDVVPGQRFFFTRTIKKNQKDSCLAELEYFKSEEKEYKESRPAAGRDFAANQSKAIYDLYLVRFTAPGIRKNPEIKWSGRQAELRRDPQSSVAHRDAFLEQLVVMDGERQQRKH